MKKNRFLKQLIALLLIAALAAAMWFSLSGRQSAAPDNPLENRSEDASHMLDQQPLDMVVSDDTLGTSESEATVPPTQTPEPSATPEPTAEPTEEPTAEPTSSPEPTAMPTLIPPRAVTPTPQMAETPQPDEPEQQTQQQSTQRPITSTTRQPTTTAAQDTSQPLLTPKPGEDANPTAGTGDNTQATQVVYFSTSILNGSTIPSRNLEFTITHKQPSLRVRTTSVLVNGSNVGQFNGRVLLEEGKNTVKVEIVYEDPEGHAIRVSKTYTVYVAEDQLVISTDLKDRSINQHSFSFTAYASLGSRAASLSVYVNGESLTSASNRYKTHLHEGTNEILLVANGEGKTIEQRFTVTVEIPENIEFITDLYDHEVDNPSFTFRAAITGGTGRAQLTVVANGQTLAGSDSIYSCTLARGNNMIRLKATDVDGAEFTQNYTISYHKYIVLEDENADETMPRISANISDGMEVTGSLYTLQIGAQDGSGTRIYGDHIDVELNGAKVPDVNEDAARTYYRLNLISGANDVVITVWDYEDRYTIYRFTVYCTVLEEGAKKGYVTVSVEATTIGLGYLIPPTKMEIVEGQNAVYPVAKLLEQCGFEYQYSGNLTDGFYLAHLLKPGITNGWTIPSDLEYAIDEDGLMWTNIYHTDSLGEQDFTQGSGWNYSVDNVYPNYSLSECYPSDGQHIRLRYTLAYGRDVGNAGDNADNYDQEW